MDKKQYSLSRQEKKVLAKRMRRNKGGNVPGDSRQISSDVKVYNDDSYKDKSKRVYTAGMEEAKKRIADINARFNLPEKIDTLCRPFKYVLRLFRKSYTTCMVINHDGRQREYMPDIPGDHRILVHRSLAKRMVSEVCMLCRVTKNEDEQGNIIDGSWAIVPAQYAMMKATTIQHMRRRRWFFLHHYWYEIDFDGRVQPAHMLFDYGLNPMATHTRFYVTHEYVKVRKTDATNDYFRFWHDKPTVTKTSSVKTV